jgi:AcrR family transcriptional regulator
MTRPALTQRRVVDGAAAVADRDGLGAVSMRAVAREVGVEAMSLYHHVADKDALLDALADWFFARVELPAEGEPWRPAVTGRCVSLRAVLGAHPWGLGLLESRGPGPALLRHHDAMLGCLLGAGFTITLAGHAFSALDSYVYGFVLTEVNLPFAPGEGAAGEYAEQLTTARDGYPHLARFLDERVLGHDYDYGEEFLPGLDLVLDSLERRLAGLG